MAKPVSEILAERGYVLDTTLPHQELIPFIRLYLFKKNFITVLFLILNILFVSSWLAFSIIYISNGTLTFGSVITRTAAGLLLSFALAPVHEFLHGIAYQLSGATRVSYKANWKKLYFMAIADKFITGRKAFYFIGLTPFIVISILLILVLYLSPPWQVVGLTALWMHATMCAGDIGLISYFVENKHRNVVMYDDMEQSASYFYSRDKNNSI